MDVPVICMIRVFNNGMWFQQKPLLATERRAKEIIARLKRKGREVMFRIWYGL